jgi:hypothetical protein
VSYGIVALTVTRLHHHPTACVAVWVENYAHWLKQQQANEALLSKLSKAETAVPNQLFKRNLLAI